MSLYLVEERDYLNNILELISRWLLIPSKFKSEQVNVKNSTAVSFTVVLIVAVIGMS